MVVRDWSFDLNNNSKTAFNRFTPPPGLRDVMQMEKSATEVGGAFETESTALIAKKKAQAMNLAMSPVKQMGMNAFMMYMSGKQLNIFSISITSTAILSPLRDIFSVGKKFEAFSDKNGKVDLQTAKLIFIALNVVWLAVGLYKMSNMRLLPTTSADWVGYIVWKENLETGGRAVM